jgi:hypothetical protein
VRRDTGVQHCPGVVPAAEAGQMALTGQAVKLGAATSAGGSLRATEAAPAAAASETLRLR